MTRTEVIKAIKELGYVATREEIETVVGANQQHVIGRMVSWKELSKSKAKGITSPHYIYTLNECIK